MKTQKQLALINVVSQLGAGKRASGDAWFSRVEKLVKYLTDRGLCVAEVITITEPDDPAEGDPTQRFNRGVLEVIRQIHYSTIDCLTRNLFPVVLGGDHSVAIGSASASAAVLQPEGQQLGLIWVDAHIDMNVPGTTPSGNIHGMALATLLQIRPGCELEEFSGGLAAVLPQNAAVVGFRFADATELPNVGPDGPSIFSVRDIDSTGITAVNRELVSRIVAHTGGLHLSLDLDALDPSVAPAVNTPAPGGLSFREMRAVCDMAATTGRLVSLDLVEHDASKGDEEIMLPIMAELIACSLGASAMPDIRQNRLE